MSEERVTPVPLPAIVLEPVAPWPSGCMPPTPEARRQVLAGIAKLLPHVADMVGDAPLDRDEAAAVEWMRRASRLAPTQRRRTETLPMARVPAEVRR